MNPKSNLKSNFVNTSDYSIYNSGLNLLSFHETDKLSSHMQRDIRVYDIESFSNAKSKIPQMANEVNKKVPLLSSSNDSKLCAKPAEDASFLYENPWIRKAQIEEV